MHDASQPGCIVAASRCRIRIVCALERDLGGCRPENFSGGRATPAGCARCCAHAALRTASRAAHASGIFYHFLITGEGGGTVLISWSGSNTSKLSTLEGDAPIKVQQDRKKLAEGHFNISTTKRVSLENSTDLGRGAAPELKSVEFLSETLFVVE